jgi:hypothetical protein
LPAKKRPDDAFIQTARVIVHRRQAGSYRRDVYMATSSTGISQSLLVIYMAGSCVTFRLSGVHAVNRGLHQRGADHMFGMFQSVEQRDAGCTAKR